MNQIKGVRHFVQSDFGRPFVKRIQRYPTAFFLLLETMNRDHRRASSYLRFTEHMGQYGNEKVDAYYGQDSRMGLSALSPALVLCQHTTTYYTNSGEWVPTTSGRNDASCLEALFERQGVILAYRATLGYLRSLAYLRKMRRGEAGPTRPYRGGRPA